jgi:hypothetical protein
LEVSAYELQGQLLVWSRRELKQLRVLQTDLR